MVQELSKLSMVRGRFFDRVFLPEPDVVFEVCSRSFPKTSKTSKTKAAKCGCSLAHHPKTRFKSETVPELIKCKVPQERVSTEVPFEQHGVNKVARNGNKTRETKRERLKERLKDGHRETKR